MDFLLDWEEHEIASLGDYRLSNESRKYISTMKELTGLDIRGFSIADSTGDQLKANWRIEEAKKSLSSKNILSTDAIGAIAEDNAANCKIVIGEPDL
ncbi:MAG: hypothetical protein R3D26_07915 [Cyanobacteriota/Melainabacteria group bacterium]